MPPDRLDIPRFIPTPRLSLLRQVAALSAELGSPAYLVGGFVRDALLKRPINDFDLVIEGDATKLGRALVKKIGGRVTVHAPFKTATWFIPETFNFRPSTLDLISARSETYAYPAALPTVKLGSLADDLRRRDFTINAMATRLDENRFGELTDPFGGRADLARGFIRVLHPNSFVDDPTRLFRAVRYAARYEFQIESSTRALIPAALPFVDQLSPERLRHELDLIFDEEDSVPMMEKLWELGIVGQVQPALPSDEATRARFQQTQSHCVVPPRAVPPEIVQRREWRWIIWLMGSSPKEIRAFSKRLHFTADLLKKILAASAIFRDLDFFKGIRPSECVARLDKLPEDAVMAVWFCAPRGEIHATLGAYLTKWKSVKPLATGETLQALGVPFGPRIGETLWRLRAAWLDGDVTSAAGEKKLLAKLLGKM
jgi:tRNA nucleotidyltransferase (CCA-adding enzyme)